MTRRQRFALALTLLLVALAPALHAQQGNTTLIQFAGVPTGSCAFPLLAINGATGDLYDCLNGAWNKVSGAGGGATTFDLIGSGTNTTATMTVGAGATLTFTGAGINNASEINGVTVTGTPNAGQLPLATSATTAAWGDPIIQGTQAAGSTTIPNPVVGGGSDYGGTAAVRAWKVDTVGSGHITIDNASAIMGNCGATTVNAHQYCGNNTASNGVAPGFVVPVLSDIASSSSSNNYTLTGTNTLKDANGIQFADQYSTTSTVGNPVTLANITGSATGGTVAANTYACEVTYNGATSGETLASPTSGTIVTTGAVSQLACAPGDVQTGTVPAGALTYNVYWQTAGAGSYWKGHASVALTTTDVQTTTPATSGSNPPVSDTALAILPTAQTALSSNPGTLVIPSTEPANSGWPGTPLAGQTILDQRNGVFLSNASSKLMNQITGTDTSVFTNNLPNPLFTVNLNGLNFEAQWHSTQFSTNTQFATYNAAAQIGFKTTAGANAFGMLGLAVFGDTFNPGQGSGGSNSVAIYAQNRCDATNCHVWAMNPLVTEEPGFRPEFEVGMEVDYNNISGTDATAGQTLIEDGIDIISGAANKPRQALTIISSLASGNWQEDIVAANYQTNGIRLQAGATGSAAIYIVPPDNTGANEIIGRNAANTANNWFIQNVGTAQFAILAAVNWIQDNSGCTVASSGFYRNCSADTFVWRNNGNTGDVALGKNTSDQLTWPNAVSIGSASNTGLIIAGNTSGTTTLLPTAAAGATTATFPANTGTVAELNLAQTWSAAQSYGSGDILPTAAGGTDLGSTALPFGNLWLGNAATNNIKLTGTGTAARIATLPDNTGTIAELNLAQSWTAAQTLGAGGSLKAANLLISPTAPTIAAAGCGGSAASISVNNGSASFNISVGTSPTSACTVTMPAATNGWNCWASDVTTNSTSVFVQKQFPAASQTTTQIVITNFSDVAAATAFVASDVVRVGCIAN